MGALFTRRNVVLAVLLIAGCYIVSLFINQEPRLASSGVARPFSGVVTTESRPEMAPAQPPVENVGKGAMQQGSNTFLSQKLATANSALAFAFEARKHPELGGFYYSMRLNSQCTQFRQAQSRWAQSLQNPTSNSTSIDGTIAAKRTRAIEDLERFCEGYGPYGDPESGRQFLQGKQLEDRLLTSMGRLQSGSTDERADAVRQVLEFGDPYILVEDGFSLFHQDENGIRVGGELVPASQAALIGVGAQLAGCDLGAPCGTTNQFLIDACVESYICAQSISEYVSKTFDSEKLSIINKYRRAIALAFQGKDIYYFLRP